MVPSGGNFNDGRGAILWGVNRQIVDGQIGGMSRALLHSGCILPSTHRQTHPASAVLMAPKLMPRMRVIRNVPRIFATVMVCPLRATISFPAVKCGCSFRSRF